MRMLLAALAVIVAGAIPVVAARHAVAVQELAHRSAGATIGRQFDWPTGKEAADPDRGYEVLAGAADSAGVNVVRMTTVVPTASRAAITYFLYMGRSESALFDRFDLAFGEWPTRDEINAGSAVVTTVSAGSRAGAGEGMSVVGAPRVWGSGYDLSFEPLARAYVSLPIAGSYVIDARSDADAERFLMDVRRYLNSVAPGSTAVTAPPSEPEVRGGVAAGGKYLPHALVAMFVVLLCAAAARDARRVGTMLLLGFPPSRIWLLVAGRVVITAAAVGAVSAVVVLATTGDADVRLAARLTEPLVAAMGLGLLLTAAAAVVVGRRIRISDLVKGRVS